MSLTKNYTISTPLPEVEDSPVPESEFELFYATFQLITELFSVFNWYEGTLEEQVQKGMTHILKGLSIFTGTVPTEEAIPAPKKKKNPFKRREDFTSDREYGQYTKATLQAGMRVRARVNYESVSEGDYGIYKQTNDGTPPAQFAWDGLGGDTYWVYWHMVEILPPASEDDDENQGTVYTIIVGGLWPIHLLRWALIRYLWQILEPSRNTFQSSNPIGQYIIYTFIPAFVPLP